MDPDRDTVEPGDFGWNQAVAENEKDVTENTPILPPEKGSKWTKYIPSGRTTREELWALTGIPYVQRLGKTFTWKTLLVMTSAYLGMKGLGYQLVDQSMFPYFQKLGVEGDIYQRYTTVAYIPWAMKGLIGAISDTFPIQGYNKRWYIVGMAIFGTIATVLLASIKFTLATAGLAAILMLAINIESAGVDLLFEGKYAELLISKPESGTDLITWVYASFWCGSVIAACMVGPISDHVDDNSVLFWMALPLLAQVAVPVCLGWLPERRISDKDNGVITAFPKVPTCCLIRKKHAIQHQKIFSLALTMAVLAVGMAVVNLLATDFTVLVYALTASVVLIAVTAVCLPPILTKATVYIFFATASYVGLSGAVDFFYTATPACVPDGPHFDYTYFQTVTKIISAVFGVLGTIVFQKVFSKRSYRIALWSTTVLRVGASLFDIFIIERWNIDIGIPDKVAYIMGDAMIYQFCLTLDTMPIVMLTSKCCPKGVEATVYAVIAGFQNFGSNVARSIGVFLINLFEVKTKPPCNFDNVPYLILIGHVLLPLLTVPLVWFLIPNKNMTDNLVQEEEAADTDH